MASEKNLLSVRGSESKRSKNSSIDSSIHSHKVRSKEVTPPASQSFNVLVLATMSAGKTLFVNALIGQELLHSANEATTACVTKVEHLRGAKHFSGACFSHEGAEVARQQVLTLSTVRAWNAKSAVKFISLAGHFKTVPAPKSGLVLHDTPGPNNSQDEKHAELMLKALRVQPYQVLCYILNASQLGTSDDRKLLEQLHRELSGQRNSPAVYFILNKVDLLDHEKGESIDSYVEKARQYLIGIGFSQPTIIPTMANVALYARKALNAEPLTRAQNLKLGQVLNDPDIDERNLINAAAVPASVKKRVLKNLSRLDRQRQMKCLDQQTYTENKLQRLVALSGLKTVEALIKHQRQLTDKP